MCAGSRPCCAHFSPIAQLTLTKPSDTSNWHSTLIEYSDLIHSFRFCHLIFPYLAMLVCFRARNTHTERGHPKTKPLAHHAPPDLQPRHLCRSSVGVNPRLASRQANCPRSKPRLDTPGSNQAASADRGGRSRNPGSIRSRSFQLHYPNPRRTQAQLVNFACTAGEPLQEAN